MTEGDFIKIIFGAALGLAVFFLKDCYTLWQQSKKSKKLLLIELPTISETINNLLIKWPDGARLISETELPQLKYFNVIELPSLTNDIASHVYKLDQALKNAETSRKIASNYISEQNSVKFKMHSEMYWHLIESSKEIIEQLENSISTKSFVSDDTPVNDEAPISDEELTAEALQYDIEQVPDDIEPGIEKRKHRNTKKHKSSIKDSDSYDYASEHQNISSSSNSSNSSSDFSSGFGGSLF